MIDWLLSPLATTALLGLLLFLSRNWILTRLKASVEHEFNTALEAVRADLRAKETQIEALRSGALTGLASRQAALDKRRLEAIDELWAGVGALAPLKWFTSMMATIKYDEALKKSKPQRRVYNDRKTD